MGYHIISSYQNDKIPSLLLFFASLIIAIWATGRGGIISFSILLIFYPIAIKIKKKYKILIITFISLLSIALYYNFSDFLYEFGLGRFDDVGLEGERTVMNAEYLTKTFNSTKYIFFGSPLSDIYSIAEVDNNPHNSFIRLHVYYGIFGFTLMVLLLIYTISKLIKKRNYLFLIFLTALLLRSFVDSIAFHGPLDPLIYFMIFYSISDIEREISL